MSDVGWEVIVVGAGVEGSATAYNLAMMRRKTLLLEQFTLPHSRGSSHGHSRITRKAYPEQFYARMMIDCYEMWAELERNTNKKLYTRTGCIVIDKVGSRELTDVESSLDSINSRAISLDAAALGRRHPVLNFDESYAGVVDPDGGVLAADKCMAAYRSEYLRHGGTLRDGEAVKRILAEEGRVTVYTDKGTYTADSVVIAAGAWTNEITEPLGLHLPLKPERVEVLYMKTLSPGYRISDNFPAFIVPDGPDREVWGLPEFEYPGLIKMAFHGGPEIRAGERDGVSWGEQVNTWRRQYVQEFVQNHMRGLDPKPAVIEPCIYTVTPDRNFILDRHPRFHNVIIGAGFSGHGFKLSPIVGKLLAQLALGQKPSHCLDPFTIGRFYTPEAKL